VGADAPETVRLHALKLELIRAACTLPQAGEFHQEPPPLLQAVAAGKR
jgi:hypothetical protein